MDLKVLAMSLHKPGSFFLHYQTLRGDLRKVYKMIRGIDIVGNHNLYSREEMSKSKKAFFFFFINTTVAGPCKVLLFLEADMIMFKRL